MATYEVSYLDSEGKRVIAAFAASEKSANNLKLLFRKEKHRGIKIEKLSD